MDVDLNTLSPEVASLFRQFNALPPDKREQLWAILTAKQNGNLVIAEPRVVAPYEGIVTPSKPILDAQPNFLSFYNLSQGKDLHTRQEFYETVQKNAASDSYCLAWGLQPERKKLGTPDEIYEIKHAFGTEEQPFDDMCLVGYWFVWRNTQDELVGEIYRYPNKAVKSDETLTELIRQVAPDWFGRQPPSEGFDDSSGSPAALPKGPKNLSPGEAKQIPIPLQVTIVGETQVLAFI